MSNGFDERNTVTGRFITTEGPKEVRYPVAPPFKTDDIRYDEKLSEQIDDTSCPYCKIPNAQTKLSGALPPMIQYKCDLCGRFYMRNSATGEYLYEEK